MSLVELETLTNHELQHGILLDQLATFGIRIGGADSKLALKALDQRSLFFDLDLCIVKCLLKLRYYQCC